MIIRHHHKTFDLSKMSKVELNNLMAQLQETLSQMKEALNSDRAACKEWNIDPNFDWRKSVKYAILMTGQNIQKVSLFIHGKGKSKKDLSADLFVSMADILLDESTIKIIDLKTLQHIEEIKTSIPDVDINYFGKIYKTKSMSRFELATLKQVIDTDLVRLKTYFDWNSRAGINNKDEWNRNKKRKYALKKMSQQIQDILSKRKGNEPVYEFVFRDIAREYLDRDTFLLVLKESLSELAIKSENI